MKQAVCDSSGSLARRSTWAFRTILAAAVGKAKHVAAGWRVIAHPKFGCGDLHELRMHNSKHS